MIEIPQEHAGCKRLEATLNEPARSFADRLEAATGKKIEASSYTRIDDQPYYVGLAGGGSASERQISISWFGARAEIRARDERAQRLIDGCPGLCQATVVLNGAEVTVPLCGMNVIEAAQEQGLIDGLPMTDSRNHA